MILDLCAVTCSVAFVFMTWVVIKDSQKNELKHGRWIETLVSSPDYYGLVFGWKCSECGYHFEDRSNHRKTPRFMKYCHNCGAKMDGD